MERLRGESLFFCQVMSHRALSSLARGDAHGAAANIERAKHVRWKKLSRADSALIVSIEPGRKSGDPMQETRMIGGRFRIVKKIGQGAGGSVFLVMNIRTEHFWAAKRIRVPDGQACHELDMMKNLRSPHLPLVVDILREDGETLWLIMEYVRGIPFDHYIEDGRTLPEDQVLETAIQTADALCYLQKHDPPIFHLDIKPENLIRTKDGRVKLVDFGAAWKKDTVMPNEGTEGYAAPEQYDRSRPKDGRTDIYGLGATLYRLVTGKKYSQILSKSQVAGCGASFSQVIRKCLEEDPDDRYRNADQLKAALLSVRRRRSMEKAKKQLLAVCAFALPAAAFCASVMPASIDFTGDEKWDYDKILEEARVLPESESREYYRKAVFMKPDDPEAYMNFLEDASADGIFSDSEENCFRTLLHTVPLGEEDTYEEILEKVPSAYGPVASRLGMIYRYQYPGEDGRRIAAGWFSKAVESGSRLGFPEAGSGGIPGLPETENGSGQGLPETEDENYVNGSGDGRYRVSAEEDKPHWLREAEYYLLLSALEGTSGRYEPEVSTEERMPPEEETGLTGSREDAQSLLPAEEITSTLSYWELLGQEGHIADAEEDPLLTLQRLYDTAWQIAFRVSDLRKAGVDPEEIGERVEELLERAEHEVGAGRISGREKAAEKLQAGIREAAGTAEERLRGSAQAGEDGKAG